MIDPVIFSYHLGNLTFSLRWYGVLVMTAIVIASFVASKKIEQKGGDSEALWDAMIWLLPAAIIGARLWYVINATIGGNMYYLNNPIQIMNIPAGGLHIYGGLTLGAAVLYWYLKRRKMSMWLFLDAIAPAALLGQALARPANFINQELYGGPTSLPWGIPIDANHRLAMFSDLSKYPLATTRFHPTFAYEMILNLIAFGSIYWILGKVDGSDKPGSAFFLWLTFEGFIRTFIEFFRPDQPVLVGWLTTSMLVAFLMGVIGLFFLLVRLDKIKIGGLKFPDTYMG